MYFSVKKKVFSVILFLFVACLSFAILFASSSGERVVYGETNFDVIKDSENNFVGIDLNDSFDKTLYAGIKSDAHLPEEEMRFAVLEFKLQDTIFDKETGGLLVQLSTKGNKNWTFFRVYAFVDGVSGYRFLSAHANVSTSRKDKFIKEDGSVITVDAVKSKNRGNLPADVSGTLVIPWADMFDNTQGVITTPNPSLRILILVDVSNATSSASKGEGVSIGKIATYNYDGGVATVKTGISTKDLTYSFDSEDLAKDVNLADFTKGKKVFCKKSWNTGISANSYYVVDTDKSTIGVLEYKVNPYTVTVNYLDQNDLPVKDSENLATIFDGVNFNYQINSAIDGLQFLGVDDEVPLNGSVTASKTITLRYQREQVNYEVVNDSDGAFYGVNITEDMDGSLYFGIKGDAQLEEDFPLNAVTEFELNNTIYDYEKGGLLIQFSTIGFAQFNTQVDVFVNGTSNRFFRVATGLRSSRTDLYIAEDGTDGSIPISKSNNCARIPPNVTGTWIIPWANMLNNTNDTLNGLSCPQMRVAIQTDVSSVFAQGNEGNGIVIGVIATYVLDDEGNVTVVKGISTKDLNYSYDSQVEDCDVNVADITKGDRVYSKKEWNTSISIVNYKKDEDLSSVSKIEYAKYSTAKINVGYYDQEGESLSSGGFAKVVYCLDGLQYSVNIPEFLGYKFESCNRELKGVIDPSTDFSALDIRLTYSKLPQVITLLYVDENGNSIKESKTIDCFYNDYMEIQPEQIKGYSFNSSSRKLKLTVLNDYTITLTYENNAKSLPVDGLGLGMIIGTVAVNIAIVLGFVLSIKKKKIK